MEEKSKLDKPLPIWFILLIPFYIAAIFSLLLFPLANDWRWLEGWVFVITFSINMGISYYFINRANPRVLRNRMKLKKKGLTRETKKAARSDWFIFPLLSIGFYGAFFVSSLNHQKGWSTVPSWLTVIGLIGTNLGVVILNLAIYQNAFASKILDINEDQKLIDTGLYAHVRHPLYAGGVLMAFFIPLALGSWWAFLPAIIAAATMTVRIKFEEEMLVKGMAGYSDYQQRVPYKLIPGIY